MEKLFLLAVAGASCAGFIFVFCGLDILLAVLNRWYSKRTQK